MSIFDTGELRRSLGAIHPKKDKKTLRGDAARRKRTGRNNLLEAPKDVELDHNTPKTNQKNPYGDSEKRDRKSELFKDHDDGHGQNPIYDGNHGKDDDGLRDDDHKHPYPPKPPHPPNPNPPEPPAPPPTAVPS